MIDTSSDRKPSKPQSQKKPLTQIQEEDEEDDLPGLRLDSEEEDDPREESKNAPS